MLHTSCFYKKRFPPIRKHPQTFSYIEHFITEQRESRRRGEGSQLKSHHSGKSVDKRRKKNKKRGKESIWKRLKMMCLCWLLLVAAACVCVPGFGSVCWQSSICNDLSNKGRILNCIHYCMSALQTEFPELSALALKVGDYDDDDILLLSIILATLTSKDKTSEPDLNAHSNKRRSYTMEHFRWGKPLGGKIAQPKLRTQSNKRRSYTMEHFRWGKPFGEKTPKLKAHSNGRHSYSMEHFRWGKPPGCKRRPVKVFTSSPEGGGSSEDGFPPLARRQLSKNEAKRDLHQESPPNKQLKRLGVNSKTHVPLGLQDRKAGTYRMSHFRWGSPAASKRNDGFMKLWQEKPRVNMLRNNIVKDIQKIMEQREGREEEVGG